MESNSPNNPMPPPSEDFGNVRNPSETFGTIPNAAETFRSVPQRSERKENHTLNVREVARMFEAAGVARTERSITNWCQPNRNGIARLDSYFDPNERKYFITPQSVELAIQEEQARSHRTDFVSEPVGSIPKPAETTEAKIPHDLQNADTNTNPNRIKELEREVMDLKITNKAKDYFIDQLKSERESLVNEQRGYVERLMTFSRQIGELKTKLLGLGTRTEDAAPTPPDASEDDATGATR